MLSNVVRELTEGRAMSVPITVEQYHRMIETGILVEGEPIELLDGFLMRKDRSHEGEDPMTVGIHHQLVMDSLGDYLVPLVARYGYRLRIQAPLTLPPDGEPEPDGAIVVKPAQGYRDGHPGAADTLVVIEVSDSSLQRDRTTKMRIYADHGIPQYVIFNVLERVVEVYSQPLIGKGSYAKRGVVGRGEVLEFALPGDVRLSVAASDLLPAP